MGDGYMVETIGPSTGRRLVLPSRY